MVLERINSVVIENFRSFSGRPEPFVFKDGLNLISGDNGSGKTSLRLAIVLGLFSKVSGKGFGSVLRGKTPARIIVNFIANGKSYTIEKTLSLNSGTSSAKLTNDDTGTETNGDQAIIDCRKLVSGTNDSGVNDIIGGQLKDLHGKKGELSKILGDNMGSLLFPEQGDLVKNFETNDVLRNIGLNKTTLFQNTTLDVLLNRTDDERTDRLNPTKFEFVADLDDEMKSNLRQNGILDSKFNSAMDLKDSIKNLEKIQLELQEDYLRLETLRSNEEELTDGDDLNKKASGLEASAEVHRNKREQTEEKVLFAKNGLDKIQALLDYRTELQEQISKSQKDLNAEEPRLTENIRIQNSNAIQHATIVENIVQSKKELKTIFEWINYEQDTTIRETLEGGIKEWENLISDIDRKSKEIKEIRENMNTIKPATKEQWKTINSLYDKIQNLRGSLSPWKLDKSSPPKGFMVNIDGEKSNMTDGEVFSSMILTDSKGEVVISISNPAQSRSITDLESELNSLYDFLGAESRAELNIRKEKYEELETELALHEGVLKEHSSKEEIMGKILGHKEKLKTRKEKPSSDKPKDDLGSWDKQSQIVDGQISAQEEVRNTLNVESGRVEEAINSLKITIDKLKFGIKGLSDEIEVHEKEYDSSSVLLEKLITARKALKEFEAILEPLNSAKDAEEIGARNQAKRLRESSEKQQLLSRSIASLETLIDSRIQNTEYSRLLSVRDDFELARKDLDLEKINTKAIVLLQQSIASLKEDKMESIYPMLQMIINNIASSLYGTGAKVTLNENGFPESLHRTGRDDIKFEWESYGTREQLNLLYRLAMLRVISDEENTKICFALDDPLVNTDKPRRKKILNHLTGLISRGNHQALVFTCHLDQYGAEHLDHHIEL